MKLSLYPFRAASSLLIFMVASLATASTRPHYGGTLRVELRDTVASIDPAQPTVESSGRDTLLGLIFDRLTQIDESGTPQPQLATSWQSDAHQRMWQFQLRQNVKFQDGTPLSPEIVVSSLKAAAPVAGSWRLSIRTPNTVVIESDLPVPAMPALLALVRYSIANHNGTDISGTGPFQLGEWQAGQRALLSANEDYWAGRPFLDGIDVRLGSVQRDQLVDVGLDHSDVVEVSIVQARRLAQASQRVAFSPLTNLVALDFFQPGGGGMKSAASDQRLREAIALSLDREAINNVLLQKQGEPAYAVLPQRLTGYAFMFTKAPDVVRARKLRSDFGGTPVLAVAYDSSDPMMKAIAERVAVNARDVGITLQTVGEKSLPDEKSHSSADMVLTKHNVGSENPSAALVETARSFHLDEKPAMKAAGPEDEYKAEHALLEDFRLIPVAFVPQAYWLGFRVKNWSAWADGRLHFDRVWVDSERQ